VRAFASEPAVERASPLGAAVAGRERRGFDRGRPPAPTSSAHRFAAVAVAQARGGAGNPEAAAVPAEPAAPAVAPSPAAPEAAAVPATPPPAQAESPEREGAVTASPGLSWTFVKTHTWDALWWFCGEHPSGFSTRIMLRAENFADPTALRWTIPRGSDKIAFAGAPSGPEVHVTSKKGSDRLDDITVRVTEGSIAGAPSHDGPLTVRKPHRLIHRFTRHHANCPAFDATCPAGVGAHWTEVGYRIVDNVGGTIVGATVNENFPGHKANDQANDWADPAAFVSVPVWPNTDGTFIDYWWVWGGHPAPVNPGAAHDGDSVDHMTHEFYVGGRTAATGCRVQTHTAHRFLGHTEHENIVTPAP